MSETEEAHTYRELTEPLGQPAFEAEREGNERPVPDAWTGHRHETATPEAGEARFYALAVRFGTLRNEPRVAPAFETLYVREDGKRAFSRTHVARQTESGWLPNPERWHSSIAELAGVGGPVPGEKQPNYQRLLATKYNADPRAEEGDDGK
jgi:hypothetical protein